MAAVGAAAALIAIVSGIGLVAADATVARSLDGSGVDRPFVRISRFAATDTDHDAIMTRADEAIDRHLYVRSRRACGVITRELQDLDLPVFELVVGVDALEPLVTLVESPPGAVSMAGHARRSCYRRPSPNSTSPPLVRRPTCG